MPRSIFLWSLAALSAGCAPELGVPGGLAFDGPGPVIAGEFVASYELGAREMEQLGLELLDWNAAIGAGLYLAEDGVTEAALRRALDQHSRGRGYVEANRVVRATSVNDPMRHLQWNFDMLDIDAARAWPWGEGVVVAVVDTGVSRAGEDTPLDLLGGWDFVDDDANPRDVEGHGTHVAGTIAQFTNNGVGVAGIAPDATVLPVRVLGPQGGSAYDVASGITWAVDQGADVINLSLGSAWSSQVEEDAVEYATDHGVVLVAASGNEASAVGYPAALPGVIAVGAVQVGKKVPRYSNGGSGLDVVAPGGNTNRDDNGDGEPDGILQETVESGHWDYEYYDGTSMATPHVSGLAALLLSAGAHRDDVPDLIRSTAEPLGGGDWNRRWGYGLIDPVAALEAIPTGPGEPEEPWEPPVTGDDTPPEISDIESRRKRRTLTLWWTTDEPATSQVLFDGYGRYGDLELVRHHELRFTIDRSETYEFQLVSEDEIGNEAYSEWFVTEP